MSLSRIFNTFSRTPEAKAKGTHEVPTTSRNRILLWWADILRQSFSSRSGMRDRFWIDLHRVLLLRHGKLRLSDGHSSSDVEDVLNYLSICPGEHFLDFLADIFCMDFFNHI